ncbi:hypothetical protein EFL77_09545 [Pediococcus pentosaceus]|uniref:hypothetical protein n=1 Tax=Pediococcus pentosaceus TaxID=1255 RepID=UPI00223B05F8|nr:hypothetical protein [Pediococcus pentosaceus]MCT1178731.1 hypothetical protein [Pediococcus pentosaceus]
MHFKYKLDDYVTNYSDTEGNYIGYITDRYWLESKNTAMYRVNFVFFKDRQNVNYLPADLPESSLRPVCLNPGRLFNKRRNPVPFIYNSKLSS